MQCIRVGAFDESPLLRAGIVQVLNAEPGMQVVTEAGSASEALRLSVELSPNVVILDANLMEEGLKLARSIAALPNVKLLVLSFAVDGKQAAAAFAVGARGYVLKGINGHDFREAVRAVHRGEGYVSPALAGDLLLSQAGQAKAGKPSNANPIARLTHREGQIFKLLSDGLTNKEIGERLDMSEKSVKRYVTGIFETLSVRNRVEAALLSRSGSMPDRSMPNTSAPPVPGLVFHPHNAVADIRALPQRSDPLTAHCFSAVFGRTSLPAQDMQEKARVHPVGTHILLR